MLPARLLVVAEILLAASVAGLSALYKPINEMVVAYLWEPSTTYYYLSLLVMCERAAVSYNANTPWRKAMRDLALLLAGYTLVLFFLHGFSTSEPTTMVWLRIFLLPFVLLHLRSLGQALSKLNMLTGDSSALLDVQIGRRLDEARRPPDSSALPPAA